MKINFKNPMMWKKIIYTLCFMGFVAIDWVRGSGEGNQWAVAVNCIGFAMFPIIVLQYKLRDFLKLPYLIWLIVFSIGGAIALYWGQDNWLYYGQWVTGIVNVGIYGFLVIRIIFKLLVEKKSVKSNWIFALLWIAMMVLMILSPNMELWPLWFFVMFGSFYNTEYSKADREALFSSMLNGIIISFFILQSFAFVFRPYDQVRYVGMYVNCNTNGLFYLITYCAWLGKMFQEREKKSFRYMRLICIFFAGATISFAFLTISRVVIISFIIVTFVFLVIENFMVYSTKLKGFIKTGAALTISFAITFFLVFACVRYLPPFFHHPVWFQGEYSEAKVKSDDKYDSEKFVNLDEFYNAVFARTMITLGQVEQNDIVTIPEENTSENAAAVVESGNSLAENLVEDTAGNTVDATVESGNQIASVSQMQGQYVAKSYEDGVKPGTDAMHPVVITNSCNDFATDSFGIRKFIYQYYLNELTLFGHKEYNTGMWLFRDLYCFHAHNSFLQLAYSFGIFVGIALFAIVVASIIMPAWLFIKNKKMNWYYILPILYGLTFLLYGQLEVGAYTGQSTFTLLFITISLLWTKTENK